MPVINSNSHLKSAAQFKKDVTKTFKKMLTSNHNKTSYSYGLENDENLGLGFEDSTKYEGSVLKNESDQQTQLSEIESKFSKKKRNHKNLAGYKQYKEDIIDEKYLEDKYDKKEQEDYYQKNKTSIDDIRQLEEFVSTKRPKDQFKDLNPLTSKVDIAKETSYQGTSFLEVFQ